MAVTNQCKWVGLGASNSGSYGVTTVANVATLIRPANSNRTSLIIQNQSAIDVLLGFDANVTTTNYFIRLRQYESYEILASNMWVGPVYAISASLVATADVSWGEF